MTLFQIIHRHKAHNHDKSSNLHLHLHFFIVVAVSANQFILFLFLFLVFLFGFEQDTNSHVSGLETEEWRGSWGHWMSSGNEWWSTRELRVIN